MLPSPTIDAQLQAASGCSARREQRPRGSASEGARILQRFDVKTNPAQGSQRIASSSQVYHSINGSSRRGTERVQFEPLLAATSIKSLWGKFDMIIALEPKANQRHPSLIKTPLPQAKDIVADTHTPTKFSEAPPRILELGRGH